MDNIIWKKDYSVEVKEIDEQHKHFFSVLNELNTAVYAKKEKEWMGHIFDQLDGYTRFHFATEEKLFDYVKYDQAELHMQKHDEFRKKLEEFRRSFETGAEGVSEAMVKFLEEWFSNHIMRVDKMYTKVFHDHGVF
jgi:hemerythrin-like metal-binding protein